MTNATTHMDYTASFAAELEKLRDSEQAATTTDQQADAPGQTSEQNADAKTAVDEGAGDGTAAAAATTEAQQGDVRGALRASRRSERQARSEAERLKAENEELRKQIPAAKDESITDEELAELAQDMPIVARALKAIRTAAPATTAAPAPAAEQEVPEFIPPAQTPEVQDLIDDIPDLLAMQNDPDQRAFQFAIQQDLVLRSSPKWQSKPLAERLAECARRVKAELADDTPQTPAAAPEPAPTAQRRAAAAVVKEAPRAQPTTLSDLSAGGSAPTKPQSDLASFMKMSNEDILNALRDD
jgi:hypothetical protein